MGNTLTGRVSELEATISELKYQIDLYQRYERPLPVSPEPTYMKRVRTNKFMSRPLVPNALNGIFPAYVVDTRDPWKIQRVRVYIPQIHRYEQMTEERFPWASPCTFFGSLDEQGWAGVPPEGSTIWVMFEMGSRDRPIYVGCNWNVTRDRSRGQSGKGGQASREMPLKFTQEDRHWGGRRFQDHNPAANDDPKQLFPPWNNESYNGPDKHTAGGIQRDRPTTYPHIYGIKTPEKHFVQLHDGDWEKKKKGKRTVIQSSKGHVLYMKDDCLNHTDKLFNHEFWDDNHDKYPHALYKVKPFNNHDIDLKNTGVWLQSVAGARLQFNDEYEKPGGTNEWDSGWQPQGKFRSKIRLESVTEHRIDLRDREDVPKERGTQNGIFSHTATGQCIQQIDHTVGNRAGEKRVIKLWSTSNHIIEMKDTGCRAYTMRSGPGGRTDYSDGQHSPTATKGHIHIKTGWGQYILMADYYSQQADDLQYIRISNHNEERDPNYIHMFCVAFDKLFFVRAAGTMMISVQHNYFRTNEEGDEFITIKKKNQFTNIIKGMDFRHSETLAFYWNTHQIDLAVGQLIKRGNTTKLEHPLYQVVVDRPCERFSCPLTGHLHKDYSTPYVLASGAKCPGDD